MIRIFILVFCFSPSFQDQWKDVYNESAWADRDRWQKPAFLIRMLDLKPGSQVADIGCHEGYMTVKLSAVVGSNGKVFAVDVEQSKLDRLKGNLQKREISNVEMVKGDYGDPHLPANSLDAVIILDTYHEMDEHDAILQHVKIALRPGGRLVLCEPIAEARKKSSREDQERKHELGMSHAIEDLKRAGFTVRRQQDPFVDRTKEKGDTMWLLVAIK